MIIVYEIKFDLLVEKWVVMSRTYFHGGNITYIDCIKRYKSNLPYDKVIDELRWYIIKL